MCDTIEITINNPDGSSYSQIIDRRLIFKVQEIKLVDGERRYTGRVGKGVPVLGSRGERYTVYLYRGHAVACTCRRFVKAGKTCKHMIAINQAIAAKRAEKQHTPVDVSPELAAILPNPVKLADIRRKIREQEAAAEQELDRQLGLPNLMRRGWSA